MIEVITYIGTAAILVALFAAVVMAILRPFL
jgi:hypothetical protein